MSVGLVCLWLAVTRLKRVDLISANGAVACRLQPSFLHKMRDLLDFLLITLIATYLVLAPYTKVEESFNIQAIHDVIFHGSQLELYDHVEFPGAVPRTFFGALIVGGITKLFQMLISIDNKLSIQIVARCLIGLANALALIKFRHAVADSVSDDVTAETRTDATPEDEVFPSKDSTRSVVRWSIAGLYIQQFHILFYASRPLPNFMAMPLVVYAYSQLFKKSNGVANAVGILSFCAIVFRSEIAVLAACVGITFFVGRKISLLKLALSGFVGLILGALISMVIDSEFWGTDMSWKSIPEVQAFIFNVIEKRASDWGVEPYPTYWAIHLPNVLNNRFLLPVIIGGLFIDKSGSKNRIRLLGIAMVLYVTILSFQPHKEWRFVIYVVPPFLAIASNFFGTIHRMHPVFFVFFVQLVILTSLLSGIMAGLKVWGSSYNYPGGVALAKFHETVFPDGPPSVGNYSEPITVHMDVPVCMTGATLFGQLYDEASRPLYPELELQPVIYDKTEDEEKLAQNWFNYDYLITIADNDLADITAETGFCWKKIESIPAFRGINMQYAVNLVKTAIGDPDQLMRPFAHSDAKVEWLQMMIAPIIARQDTAFIYEKRPEGAC